MLNKLSLLSCGHKHIPDFFYFILDSCNVIPIMISASFLQMEPLLDESLRFLQQRMNEVLQTNANFSCINDLLLTRFDLYLHFYDIDRHI